MRSGSGFGLSSRVLGATFGISHCGVPFGNRTKVLLAPRLPPAALPDRRRKINVTE
jgi:hypothetical protein